MLIAVASGSQFVAVMKQLADVVTSFEFIVTCFDIVVLQHNAELTSFKTAIVYQLIVVQRP
jgi:hypothetical protein